MTNNLDNTNTRQRWVIKDAHIVNCDRPEEALDIKGNDDDKKAKVQAYKFHGNPNQCWNFVPWAGDAE